VLPNLPSKKEINLRNNFFGKNFHEITNSVEF